MASLRKNIAGQNLTFCLVSTTTGLGVPGATVTISVVKDNGAQAAGGGTVTNSGNGQYNYAPTQAETNAVDVGFFFSASGCIPCNLDFHTDDPTLAEFGVNVVQWNGTVVATPATAGIPDVNVKNINNISGSGVSTVNANMGTTQPINFTGTGASAFVQGDTKDWGGTAVGTIPPDAIFLRSGTAQGGSSTSITLDAGASATNNFYNAAAVFIRSGTGAGQTNIITSYVGATKVATTGTWATAPDNTSVFTIAAFGPSTATVSGTVNANVTSWLGTSVSAATAGIPDVNTKNWGTTAVGTIPPDVIFLHSGTAQGGTSTSITLDTGASAVSNFYNSAVVFIRSGTGAGQTNIITTYNGASKVATTGAWATAPDATSVFTIAAFGPSQATVSGTVNSNVISWLGTGVSAATAGIPDVNAKNINNLTTGGVTAVSGNVGTTQPINFTGTGGTALVQTDVIDWRSAAVAAPATAGIPDTNTKNWGNTVVGAIPPDVIFLRSGTAQGGGAGTITLDAGASAVNNFYNSAVIFIRSGTGAGQTNIITAYNGGTKVATVGAWATNPDATSVFTIAAFGPSQATVSGTVNANVTSWNGASVAVPATSGIPDVNVKNYNNFLATTDGNNLPKVDTEDWKGSAVLAPATAGIPDVNTRNINNLSTTGVTAVGGNVGTTQPVNFTGTGGTALVKSDAIDISSIPAPAFPVNFSLLSVDGSGNVSIMSNIKKNSAQSGVMFVMTNSTTHNPQIGLSVSASRSIDGGGFAPTTNTPTEVANGTYSINLTAADTNGNHIMLRFTAPTADDLNLEIVTQP